MPRRVNFRRRNSRSTAYLIWYFWRFTMEVASRREYSQILQVIIYGDEDYTLVCN